jgi:ElaB/YqjD/DUF883 family membrane-anchored ribosome-binding protein
MAKGSDELERELELKRQQLHTKVDKLRERIAGDVRGMRDHTQEELSTYLHKAESQVTEHPWLSLAGSFGGGVALGMTTGGSGSHKGASNGHAASEGQGESVLARGVNALVGAAGGPVFDEVRNTLQETLSEMKSTLKESMSDVVHGITGTANGHTPNSSPAEHRQRVRDHVAA